MKIFHAWVPWWLSVIRLGDFAVARNDRLWKLRSVYRKGKETHPRINRQVERVIDTLSDWLVGLKTKRVSERLINGLIDFVCLTDQLAEWLPCEMICCCWLFSHSVIFLVSLLVSQWVVSAWFNNPTFMVEPFEWSWPFCGMTVSMYRMCSCLWAAVLWGDQVLAATHTHTHTQKDNQLHWSKFDYSWLVIFSCTVNNFKDR